MFTELEYFQAMIAAHKAGFLHLYATLKSLYLRDYPQGEK